MALDENRIRKSFIDLFETRHPSLINISEQ